MLVRLINITSHSVFVRYSKKYNIFRDLYELGSFGLEIRHLPEEFANRIQKIFLKHKELCYIKVSDDKADILALGTIEKLEELSKTIKSGLNEELGLRISNVLHNYMNYDKIRIDLNGQSISIDDIIIMGILNVTPDSFSDGGKFSNSEDAVARGLEMLDEGADIIDIGGESTRPGADPVSVSEELERVIPVIEGILQEKPDSILSIDTTKSEVAERALDCGCKIINDISGCTSDDRMFEVASKNNTSLILMHMQGNPLTMQDDPKYYEVISEVYEFLTDRIKKAKKYNIKNIIIDPGIGFGKRLIDNYEILERLEEFKCLGYPILISVSRKSLLGKALNLEINDRDIASVITESIAMKHGARIIRTHNIRNIIQAKKLFKFIANPELVLNV